MAVFLSQFALDRLTSKIFFLCMMSKQSIWLLAWPKMLRMFGSRLTDKFTIVLPVLLASVIAPWCLCRNRFRDQQKRLASGMVCLAAGCVIALLIWFLQAPAGRFAFVYFYLLFAVIFVRAADAVRPFHLAIALSLIVGVAAAYALLGTAIVAAEYRTGMVLLVAFCTGWCALAGWALARRHSRVLAALCLSLGVFQVIERGLGHALRGRLELVRPLLWVQVTELPETLRQAQYTRRRTQQGWTVYEAREISYDTPVPNTKYFNPSLQLRVPGDLAQGFRNPHAQDPIHHGYSVRIIREPGAKDREEVIPD